MRRFEIHLSTNGDGDVRDLTDDVHRHLHDLCPPGPPTGMPDASADGVLHLFVVGSTAALTTIEYEPGLVRHDLLAVLQRLAPDDAEYQHEATWNDDNGHSHVRASMIGPSLSIPFAKGRLMTGQWQQVVLIDFDTRPRKRTVIGTVLA